MGNLYTQYRKGTDHRLTILYQLKVAWRTTPKDWEKINKLKKELKRIESKWK